MIDELERRLSDARKGKRVDQRLRLVEPEDHTDNYERVLRMLEMSVDDEIQLDEHDFAQYVMDNGRWKDQFVTTAEMYSAVDMQH